MKFKLFVIFALIIFVFCSCSQTPETYTPYTPYTPPEEVHDPENPCRDNWCTICHPELDSSNYVSYAPKDNSYKYNYYYIFEDTAIKRIRFNNTVERGLDSRPVLIEIWQLPVGLSFKDPEFYSELEDAAEEAHKQILSDAWDNMTSSERNEWYKRGHRTKTNFINYYLSDGTGGWGMYSDATEWLFDFKDMDPVKYTSLVPPDIIYEGTYDTDTYYEKNDDYKEGSTLITERMFNEYEYVKIDSVQMIDIYEYKNGSYILKNYNSGDWYQWKQTVSLDNLRTDFSREEVWNYIRDNGIPLVGNPYKLSRIIYDSYEDNGEYYEGYFGISSEAPHERISWEDDDPYKNETLKTYVCTKEEALSNASILANQTFSHTLPSLSDLQ